MSTIDWRWPGAGRNRLVPESQPAGTRQPGLPVALRNRPSLDERVMGGSVPSMMFLLVWLHVLAAVSWIGGTIFLSLVLAPLVRGRKAAPECMALFRSAAQRFRSVAWSAIVLLLTTGPLLLHLRGLSLLDSTEWPPVLRIKLGMVGAFLLLSLMHDLLLGSQVRRISAISEGSRSSWEQTIVRTASWVPRVGLLLALGVIFAAVVLTHR